MEGQPRRIVPHISNDCHSLVCLVPPYVVDDIAFIGKRVIAYVVNPNERCFPQVYVSVEVVQLRGFRGRLRSHALSCLLTAP